MRRPGAGLVLPALLLPVVLAPATASRAQTKPAAPSQKASPAPRTVAMPRGAAAHRGPAATRPAECTHTVRGGDSVSRIAMRHRVARAALVAANHLANPGVLHLGQRLTVPGCGAVAETAASVRPAEESTDGSVVKPVGPRRVLTELVLAEPDFQGQRIPLIWPVEGPVISTFGRRRHGWHAGIDISAERGAQILAAAPGTVIYSGWMPSYGLLIKIKHMNGFMTVYAHSLKNLVEDGDEVEAGQVIAIVGSSGDATGPHLHFEVQREGRAYNPLHLLEPSDRSPVFEAVVAASSSVLDHHE